jgi:DNA ligase-1
MKVFAALYRALDASTSQRAKQAALGAYLASAAPADAAWAVYFLAGGKPRQMVPTRRLRAFALQATGWPEWLFEESYQAVGDLAETLALLLPPPARPIDVALDDWLRAELLPLRGRDEAGQLAALTAQCEQLDAGERLVHFKLITGAFRVGVSRLQVTQALATHAGLDARLVAQRLMGYTQATREPTAEDFQALIAPAPLPTQGPRVDGQPYPFFLAHGLPMPLASGDGLGERGQSSPADASIEHRQAAALQRQLGDVSDWQIEWKWDGIRAQLVCRGGQAWLWSRGEELVTDRFPEIAALAGVMPAGTVIDGELLVWPAGEQPAPFAALQKRVGRKTLGPRVLRELPVVLLAYDLLEADGQDLREAPTHARRARLEQLVQTVSHPALRIAAPLQPADWPAAATLRSAARDHGVEGLMLKQRAARYGVGRTREAGTWWKWKLDPLSVDAVLIYAQRGHGRRASLYSDYTFAVWDAPANVPDRRLVPFAKAYSGLSDAEMKRVDAIVRKTTVESFGPVRSVTPTLVFELGFEGISASPRHKSGIAVRFPRMLRWREDKPAGEADSLDSLRALLGHSSSEVAP